MQSTCLLILLTLSCLCEASGIWRDAQPKLVSKGYHTSLRSFQGQHFGLMTLTPDKQQVMVGAQNRFYLINLTQPLGSSQGLQNYTWYSDDSRIEQCLLKGVEEWECQNFIEVMQRNEEEDNRTLVCGTNAQTPKCRYFTDNALTSYEETDGTFKCPFNPKQEGTALFAGGNLYAGAARDYTARDSAIFRTGSDNVLISKEMDSNWLKIPSFVNSFDVGDWVMFFFREVAVEYTSGDAVYSRVAKVCKNDQGGAWISRGKWTTFQKIRLNCSFPGAFPFYFNFLQDVHMLEAGNETMFYGVFTTGLHEIPGSAVCVFSLNTIKDIMNQGEFKEQQGGAWYPASPPSSITRPGNCDINSLTMPSQSAQWITNHPLMHESVPNHNNPLPIFDLTRADFRLTQIAVHTQQAVDAAYEVLFLGTDDSRILKVVLVPTEGGGVQSNLLEEISLHPEDSCERVINMEIVTNHEGKEVLIVNTNSSIMEVALQRCTNYTNRCGCVQDPYCVWNNFSDECYEFTGENSFDDQDVPHIQECPDEPPPPTTPVPECICETSAPPTVSTTRYTTTAIITTTNSSTTTAMPTTTVPTTAPTTFSSTTPPLTTSLFVSAANTGDGDSPGRSTTGEQDTDNNIHEGQATSPSQPLSTTTMGNAIGPLDPQKNYSILESGNVLVLVFLIMGWILVTFCGLVILYQCYSRHHKGTYLPTNTEESILSASIKAKAQKDLQSTPNLNGKGPPSGLPPSGTPTEPQWSPPSRTSHTPAGRERESLGPVNGQSLPRRPMPVPTPTVPSSYRSPNSFAYTVGSLPSPARMNKYTNGTSTFNSLDRHRTPAHNLYVDPRAHDMYSPYSGPPPAMTAEDRRPSGASDSEMYDDDVWQPRMEGEELV